jgi:DNA-binding response OmpR family regulator
LRGIGRDPLQQPIDLGRSTLVKSGKPQDAFLPDPELIDVVRQNFCLDLIEPTIQIGRLVFNESTSEVRADGRTLDLRASERRLLALLMRQAGRIVSKCAIEERFSEFGRELSDNAVEAHVSRLRKALEETPAGVFIETIRGVGYALKETSM